MVVNEDEKVVIDTNELIAQKLQDLNTQMKAAVPEDFTEEALADPDAERVAALLGERDLPEDGSGFSEGIKAQSIETESVYTGPSAEELIDQAQEEIAQMKAEAEAEIRKIKEEAREAGHQEGYQAGHQEALKEAEKSKAELDKMAAALDAAYEQKVKELEPKFIESLTAIYEHVLKINLEADSKAIVYLAENAIRGIEGSREFMVHVSKEDYPTVNMQKKQLLAAAGASGVTIDVISDATLTRNECMIETEGGIFDCGIGTQLEELSRQIKLLAYSEVRQ